MHDSSVHVDNVGDYWRISGPRYIVTGLLPALRNSLLAYLLTYLLTYSLLCFAGELDC